MSSTLRSAITASIVLLSIPALALAAGPVRFGIKGGLAVTNIDPSEIAPEFDIRTKTKNGPVAGAFATWELSEDVGLQGELLYVSKGFSWAVSLSLARGGPATGGTRVESEGLDESGNLLEILQVADYLEIPLLLRGAWLGRGPVVGAVVAGPAVSFKVRERFKVTGAVEGSEKTDHFDSSDVGVAVGGELRFQTGPGWSLIEARYTQGLARALGEEKNRAFTIMAGYAF